MKKIRGIRDKQIEFFRYIGYPHISKIAPTPTRFWNKLANQKKFLEWLGKQLGYHSMDDWYNITQEDICSHGGSTLLKKHYGGAPSHALLSVFPEHNWTAFRFHQVPKGLRDRVVDGGLEEKKKMILWMSECLSVRELEDWYRVPLNKVQSQLGGFKNLASVLMEVYPSHSWNVDRLLWKST